MDFATYYGPLSLKIMYVKATAISYVPDIIRNYKLVTNRD